MTSWWDEFVDDGGLPELETWLGGVDAPSRVRLRERIAECHYETVLDCGAGLGLDYVGLQNSSHEVAYLGVEPSAKMREAAQGMVAQTFGHESIPIVEGNIEALPAEDASYDLVFARHILEHLPHFEPGLREMLRVARLETIVVFFIRPGAETYMLRERDGLWHNRWAKNAIEAVVAAEPRAEVWFWETLGSEVLLHVYMRAALKVTPDLVAARVRT